MTPPPSPPPQPLQQPPPPPSPTSNSTSNPNPRTYTVSKAIHDRASTFLALYSPTTPPKELQSHPLLASASHRILASRYRRPTSKPQIQTRLSFSSKPPPTSKLDEDTTYDTAHDSDGERGAGHRVSRLLAALDVEGAVVVGRWFGGTMLGPVRFAHMERVAREAVGLWGSPEGGGVGKRKRGIGDGDGDENDEDGRDKSRLVRVLEERDASVETLRGLLREKKRALAEAEDLAGAGAGAAREGGAVPNGEAERVTPRKVLDYAAMPVPALVRLEKARDATIAWILGEISKVEEKLELPKT